LGKAKSAETATKAYNDAVKSFGPTLKKLNKDPMFADIAVNHATRQQYDAVVQTIFNQHLAQSSANLTFNEKTRRAVVYQMTPGGYLRAHEVMEVAEHADTPVEVPGFPAFRLIRDQDGYVIGMEVLEDMAQSEDLLDFFLSHHGVKGMRWGVRKRSSGKASGDSKRTADLRSKPIHTLTNKQLKAANERLNLEQNFARMNPGTVAKGKKTAAEILSTVGIAVSVYNLATSSAGRAAISAGKRALSR
jgi:hypothetical protein